MANSKTASSHTLGSIRTPSGSLTGLTVRRSQIANTVTVDGFYKVRVWPFIGRGLASPFLFALDSADPATVRDPIRSKAFLGTEILEGGVR